MSGLRRSRTSSAGAPADPTLSPHVTHHGLEAVRWLAGCWREWWAPRVVDASGRLLPPVERKPGAMTITAEHKHARRVLRALSLRSYIDAVAIGAVIAASFTIMFSHGAEVNHGSERQGRRHLPPREVHRLR